MIDRFAGLGIVLLASAFLSTGSSLSAAEKAGTDMTVAASIAVLTRTDGLTLVGRAQALTDADGAARMVVTKKGASGRVSTTQGGDFALSAGDSADVARYIQQRKKISRCAAAPHMMRQPAFAFSEAVGESAKFSPAPCAA